MRFFVADIELRKSVETGPIPENIQSSAIVRDDWYHTPDINEW